MYMSINDDEQICLKPEFQTSVLNTEVEISGDQGSHIPGAGVRGATQQNRQSTHLLACVYNSHAPQTGKLPGGRGYSGTSIVTWTTPSSFSVSTFKFERLKILSMPAFSVSTSAQKVFTPRDLPISTS